MSPVYFAHSLRTFGCATAFARAQKLAVDEEGLYLASIFHDTGLFPPWRDSARAFQLVSAGHLRAFCAEHGVDAERTERLAASIEYHVLPVPKWKLGNEVGLLHVGAWADAVGWRRWSISDAYAALEREFPRGAFVSDACRLVAASVGSAAALFGMVMPDRYRTR